MDGPLPHQREKRRIVSTFPPFLLRRLFFFERRWGSARLAYACCHRVPSVAPSRVSPSTPGHRSAPLRPGVSFVPLWRHHSPTKRYSDDPEDHHYASNWCFFFVLS